MRRRSFLRLLGGFTAPASLAALTQPGPKLVAVLMHGGAYRVGFDGLKQTVEAETSVNSIRLVLQEGDGDMNAFKNAAAEFEKSGAISSLPSPRPSPWPPKRRRYASRL